MDPKKLLVDVNNMMLEVKEEHDGIVDRIDQLNREIAKLQSRRIYLEGRFSVLNELSESNVSDQSCEDSDN